MGDIADDVSEAVEAAQEKKDGDGRLNSIVAISVAITATFMALCNVKDDNVVQAMSQAQTKAVDTWAFYQAKSTKQHLAESMVDQLQIQRDTINPGPEARALLEGKIADYSARVVRYEKEKGEIKKQAEDLGAEYDRLNFRDDQFDIAEALLSVGVALMGVTALTQKKWLLGMALVFVACGFVMGLAGFLQWHLHPDWLAKVVT